MDYKIKAESRETFKKKVKNLRKNGTIPGAIYGFHGNHSIQLSQLEFTKLYNEVGHTTVVKIDVNGQNHNAYIEEVQYNPVNREYTHVSFKEINMNVETTGEIPFELQGADESPAVKDQESMVILSKGSVILRGLPKDLPSVITIDVSKFNAGDTITLKEIKLPAGVEIVHEDELEEVIVTTASAIQEEIEIDVDAATAEAVEAVEGSAETAEGEEKEEEK